jgi:hypothetical protein
MDSVYLSAGRAIPPAYASKYLVNVLWRKLFEPDPVSGKSLLTAAKPIPVQWMTPYLAYLKHSVKKSVDTDSDEDSRVDAAADAATEAAAVGVAGSGAGAAPPPATVPGTGAVEEAAVGPVASINLIDVELPAPHPDGAYKSLKETLVNITKTIMETFYLSNLVCAMYARGVTGAINLTCFHFSLPLFTR